VVALPIPEEDEDTSGSRGHDDFGMSSISHSQAISANSQVMAPSLHSQSMNGRSVQSKYHTDTEENEVLTSSMQSLVNGLMNWGGQYDDEEDFALPTGMAASIALEESAVLGAH
jgi:glutaminase